MKLLMNTNLYRAKELTKEMENLIKQLDYQEFLHSHLNQIQIELQRQIEIEEKIYLKEEHSF